MVGFAGFAFLIYAVTWPKTGKSAGLYLINTPSLL